MWCGTVCGVVKVEETALMEMQWSEEARSNAAFFVQHPVILQHLLLLEKIHSTEKMLFLSPVLIPAGCFQTGVSRVCPHPCVGSIHSVKVYYEQSGHNPHPALSVTGHTRKEGHNFCLRRSIDTTMVLEKSYVSITTSLSPTNNILFSRVQASNPENHCQTCQCDEAMYLEFILCSFFGECTSQHWFLNPRKTSTLKLQGQTLVMKCQN